MIVWPSLTLTVVSVSLTKFAAHNNGFAGRKPCGKIPVDIGKANRARTVSSLDSNNLTCHIQHGTTHRIAWRMEVCQTFILFLVIVVGQS